MQQAVHKISSEFPYESKYADVLGSQIHYIEQGAGDPIVFLHGIMTSNYSWRNIIPALTPYGRCIAPDLIGMGKSGKPDIEYRIFDHIRYIEAFIDKLKLKNITFVLHSLGSAIGFDYAVRHPENVKGLAFIEPLLPLLTDVKMLSFPEQEFIAPLQNKKDGYRAVVEDNYLMEKVLPSIELRQLTANELQVYREPYLKPEYRKPLWQYIQDLPLPNGPQDVKDLFARYTEGMQKLPMPKLLLYSMPGLLTTMEIVTWIQKHLPNIELVDLGEALHCPQETCPESVSNGLVNWIKKNTSLV